jgi:hypothetical protein
VSGAMHANEPFVARQHDACRAVPSRIARGV